jgi:hypothetical protein
MSTPIRTLSVRRPVREVTLPGGSAVTVRSPTLAELRFCDQRAAELAGVDGAVRSAILLAASALCEADGTPYWPDPTAADLDYLESVLTAEQVEAVCRAAVPPRDAAKNY